MTVRAAKESLAGWIAERDNEGDNTGDGAYLVEPRSFLMIGPCAICAAPKATELARSSVERGACREAGRGGSGIS